MRYTIAILFLIPSLCFTQMNVNTTIQSRYNWRGIDYGNAPAILPSLTYSFSDVTVGIMGAYTAPLNGSTYDENDFWIEYRVPTSLGTVSFMLTDLYFPYLGKKFFDFSGNGNGSHTLEAGIQMTGQYSFPLTARLFYVIHNDPDYSAYAEAEVPYTISDIQFTPFVGFVLTKSSTYGTAYPALFNGGIKATKELKLNESLSFLLTTSWIVNFYTEQSFVIFSLSM